MSELQYFKENDELEHEVADCFLPEAESINDDRDDLSAGAYTCFSLGEALWNANRAPLVGVVTKDVFTSSFFKFFQLFERPGTFEYYLEVFRAIWGETVEVEFVVPAAGQLEINVTALESEDVTFVARRIVDDAYVFYDVLTEDDDNLIFGVPKGLKTQAEAEKIIVELYPAGVFTTITLLFEE